MVDEVVELVVDVEVEDVLVEVLDELLGYREPETPFPQGTDPEPQNPTLTPKNLPFLGLLIMISFYKSNKKGRVL